MNMDIFYFYLLYPFIDEETEAHKWEDYNFFKIQNLMKEVNRRFWSSGAQSSLSLHADPVSNSSQGIFIR